MSKISPFSGDNIQTAVSVGKECGIIEESSLIIEVIATYSAKLGPNIRFCSYDEDLTDFEYSITDQISSKFQDPEISCHRYQFVLTGASWSNIVEYFPDVVHGIATRGVVFSRMSAHQKQQLIEILKNMRYYVAMCGDGANDCAALKAAHLGISLSDAETSIAAPFTSKEPNISCVPNIIREGRAALLTSFGVFEFMICSSLTEFFCTIILYSIDCNLSSMQFFFVDIFLQWNFASFFGNAAACDQLYREPPLTSLLSFVPLMSMTLFMLQAVSFQLFAFYFTRSFDWYKPFAYKPHMADVSKCQENYFTFVITMFQYITMAIIFSKGKPYRQPIYTNKIFTILLILLTLVCSYITLYSPSWMLQIFEMNIAPEMDARWEVLFIAFLNFLLALFIESFLVNMMLVKMIVPRFKNYRKTKHINDINLVKANVKNDETMVVRKENERSNGLS